MFAEPEVEDKAVCRDACQISEKCLNGRSAAGIGDVVAGVFEGRVFYEFYQISIDDESDIADEYESGRKGELTNTMQGSHSLFGLIWSLQKETGWSHEYILWGESWMMLQLKLADSPRMVKKNDKRVIGPENWDDQVELLNLS